MKQEQVPELCKKQKPKIMEALLVINSILVAVSLYFVKDFHGDFKEVAKKVGKLQDKVNRISLKLSDHVESVKKKLKKVKD